MPASSGGSGGYAEQAVVVADLIPVPAGLEARGAIAETLLRP